jgi:hypothetical protein
LEYLRGCWNLKKGIKTAPSVLREDPLLLRTVRCRLALRRRESFEYLCLYAFDLSQAFNMIFLFRERIRSLELTLYYLITGPHSRIGSVPKIKSGFTRVCGNRVLGEMRKTVNSGLFIDAFWEHFCSHNPESFLFFLGISASADMKKAEVPFRYPSCDKMVWNL